MSSKNLRNKPLVEAILEARWDLSKGPGGQLHDPGLKLALGRFYDKIRGDYPYHEPLPASVIPDGLAPQIVQHRFRKAKDGWPLTQLGPGVATLNVTESYDWEDFEKRAITIIETLFDTYPPPLEINQLMLRYINSVDVNFGDVDAASFIRDNLKIHFELPSSVFEDGTVNSAPDGLILQTTYACSKPNGKIQIKFARGQSKGRDAIIWETLVHSIDENLPDLPGAFPEWLNAAHDITESWFFKLIEGDLESQFKQGDAG